MTKILQSFEIKSEKFFNKRKKGIKFVEVLLAVKSRTSVKTIKFIGEFKRKSIKREIRTILLAIKNRECWERQSRFESDKRVNCGVTKSSRYSRRLVAMRTSRNCWSFPGIFRHIEVLSIRSGKITSIPCNDRPLDQYVITS